MLIAIPESGTGLVLDAGHEAWALPPGARRRGDAVFGAGPQRRAPEEANAIVVGELFAGTHARAALPGVMAAVAEWLPDVIMHETCEFAGALTAERAGLPSVPRGRPHGLARGTTSRSSPPARSTPCAPSTASRRTRTGSGCAASAA